MSTATERCADCGRRGYRTTVGTLTVVGHLHQSVRHPFRLPDLSCAGSPYPHADPAMKAACPDCRAAIAAKEAGR